MSIPFSLVDISGGAPLSSSSIDTSNLVSYAHANRLFVNEEGDTMRGTLNMKNNKIINLSNQHHHLMPQQKPTLMKPYKLLSKT